MILKLKNYHIAVIGKVLNYPTTFQVGRMKMRFLKIFGEKSSAIEASRMEMLKELAPKDEKTGKPVIKEGKFDLPAEALEKFNTEYQAMMIEECPVDFPESFKADMPNLKSLFNNSPVQLDNREMAVMEEVLTAVDEMNAPAKPAAKAEKGEKVEEAAAA